MIPGSFEYLISQSCDSLQNIHLIPMEEFKNETIFYIYCLISYVLLLLMRHWQPSNETILCSVPSEWARNIHLGLFGLG
jgi:hypothetical protein